ncbi:serine/threonine-protein kinase ATR-like isoform X1 [Tachypleus tridentatus]|uniref:serine/threonine-protein kinase ATR-like isoform X1 n=1 Tax=Tachypleus tridentatus TaxID=6853 RepID=UPI003FD0C05C
MIVKNDVKTAVFLLPHIMVNVLQDASNEEKEDIYREIMAVLSHVDQAEQSKLKFHEKTDLCHLSAQSVFSILDCLTVWCHQYFVMLRSSNQNNSKPANKGKVDPHNDPNYKSVYDFLKSVPEDLLAPLFVKLMLGL